MKLYTIGFTKSSAERFFQRLLKAKVKRVVDVRLNNVSQLAGFAKKDDLRYFLSAIGDIGYDHRTELAPTQEMLDDVKKAGVDWLDYEKRFLALMKSRKVEKTIPRSLMADACLLCSEDRPQHCHRRLVAEYLEREWGDIEILHL